MKGTILDYSIQKNDGVITADDGTRYKFTGADWKADSHPERGQKVDFDVSDGKAVDIYMALVEQGSPAIVSSRTAGVHQSSVRTKSKVTAGVLAIVLGGFGVHKFYLGYVGTGFIFLAIWIVGLLIFIGPLVVGVIGIIEGIRYLSMSDEQFDQTYVKNSKLWF